MSIQICVRTETFQLILEAACYPRGTLHTKLVQRLHSVCKAIVLSCRAVFPRRRERLDVCLDVINNASSVGTINSAHQETGVASLVCDNYMQIRPAPDMMKASSFLSK